MIIEIYLFIKVGSQIGAFNTILLIFVTAFLGVIYARYEGFNTLRSGMSQIVKNQLVLQSLLAGTKLHVHQVKGIIILSRACSGRKIHLKMQPSKMCPAPKEK